MTNHELRIGETIGAYRIRRVLGRGGAGTVYEAAAGDRTVALKVMHAHDPSGVGRKRFTREAALVQKLIHPHVVTLEGFGHTDGGTPYIVFELLPGQSLKTRLRRSGPFEPHEAGLMAMQLLDALVAAHALGIIHRDIKPANIFLCDDHPPPFVKVLDFGLAKALEGEGAEVATITDTGYRLGTPRYMSPEMARGQPVGDAGDIYGIGLVLAEMISGVPVVQGASQIDVLMEHANNEALPLPAVVVQCAFGHVAAKALQKGVTERYASAREMRDALARVVGVEEQARQIAQRFGNVPVDAQTLVYEAPADPMLATDEMVPASGDESPPSTTEPVIAGPDNVRPAAPDTSPVAIPAQLAATMAFPEEFDASLLAPRPAPRAPTLPVHQPSVSDAAPLQRPKGADSRALWVGLAVVVLLILVGVGWFVFLLR